MKRRILSMVLVLISISFFSGCQQTRQSRTDIAMQEAGRLAAPTKALSGYSSFVLEGMEFSKMVKEDNKKVTVGQDLENKLATKIIPLINDWNTKQVAGSGTVIIRPVLQSLRVVSGGARFFVGAMAGDSSIDMDLVLVDKTSGKEIARPRIMRTSGGMGGAWSVGATDKNLSNYIVDIAYEYLARNNMPAQ